MKTRLLKELRRKAYNRVKIDEDRFRSEKSFFLICLYDELYCRQISVFDVNEKEFESKEYACSRKSYYGCNIYGLDSAIHWLKEARRVFILQEVNEMRRRIKAERERVKEQEREDYLHSF